ncbi:MAG: ATP-binding cassette domain-containing protein [Deinococcales bacterium]
MPSAGLEITGLTHSFGATRAVDDLDLMVGAGEIVGLVGRNGAGKTTTMRAVMGILRPDDGQIRWRQRRVTDPDRLRFGYMPEERGLYLQMGVLEQVAYFGRLHGMDRSRALRAARDLLRRLGLEGREGDKLVALSHGNQQRVQLAVALVHQPELLVLDEAFAGLDPSAVDTLSAVLRDEARRPSAVFFSSHQLEIVERLCDRVVILERGRVLASGTLAELQARTPRRLRVKVGGGARWIPTAAGVSVVEEDARGAVLALDAGVDAQVVLREALTAGPVETFAIEEGTLADVYRGLVSP